ncbi:hypothetical protein J2X31_001499 [Flavobacterium arsenatis]|uniref:Uncharacterized protein n=1 Tax=Flavobacterium arsenatis TaxID=1484332 RepID=A0ABU1TNP7_9FLAO|nr:hypothetical protein [Flavobacterium arsenatis]
MTLRVILCVLATLRDQSESILVVRKHSTLNNTLVHQNFYQTTMNQKIKYK